MAAAFCASPPPSSSSCILKSHTLRRGTCFNAIGFLHRSPRFRTSQRKYASPGSCEVVRLSTRKTCGNKSLNLKAIPSPKESTSRCSCFGSFVDSGVIAASEFISVSDQLLLMASIFLTYMAGVIPANNYSYLSQKGALDNSVVVDSSAPSGSAKKNDDHANLNYPWDSVKGKLLNSLAAIEHGSDFRNSVLEFEQERAKRPLSLYALSEGPKLRLLLASFHWLEQEVNRVLGDTEAVNMEDWLVNLREIIQKFSYPVCMAWLVGELRLGHNKFDEAVVSSMFEKLKRDDTLLQNIRKLGKEDLYAELLYFLQFGSLRKSCSYDDSLFMSHGNSILEDFVITLADGIANLYLELISVDGVLSNEMTSLGMDICNLSTRAIQKLRNEVALNQWLYQNVEAIVSMYEDRFDLFTLQLKSVEEPTQKQTKNQSWWRKLTLGKSEKISSSLCCIIISKFSMPVKRTKELRALTGWRYYFSLCLELSDISMPLIRAVIDNVSNAISFLLVSLIGRSLGLIYTGIRQSLRWK